MALTDVLTEAGRQIRDAFSPRGGLIEKLRGVKAKHAADATARARAIAAAQREVDKLDEPRRRLEQLRAEEYGAGLAADRETGAIENELRDPAGWPRALRLLARDLERFREAWSQPLPVHEECNRITGERRITNLKDFEQRQEAIALLAHVRRELHQGDQDHEPLWKLAPTALHTRIEEIRGELGKYDRDDIGAADEGDEDEARAG